MISPKLRQAERVDTQVTRGTIERIWMIALLVIVLFFAFVNLPYAPRTWFDEGSHLHVPKTIVQHGKYADISSEGFRYYGPTVGIGPTIMLPVALMFQVFGIGLTQGRLVIVAYMLVALVAFYSMARRLHGRNIGLVAVTVLLASSTFTQFGFIEYGRHVLGEVPGIAFLLLGLLAWHKALQQPGWRWPLLAGSGFGLALVTKNQFVLIIPPSLVVIGLLDYFYYKIGNWRLRLVPLFVACACYGVWTLAQFQFLGPGSFLENMEQTRQAAGGSIFVFDLRATLRAGKYLVWPLYGGTLIPSLVYALWQARHRSSQGFVQAFIVIICGLWLTWFVGASLGWPRYAFPAVAFGAIIVARALSDLFVWLRNGSLMQRRLAFGVVGYAVVAIAVPLAFSANKILHPDDTTHRFAAYMNANVPEETVVETWEPELGVLTDHQYHYPPIALLDTAVRHQWLGGPPIAEDGLRDRPEYVVVGDFSNLTQIYWQETLEREYVQQQQIGSYILFKRK